MLYIANYFLLFALLLLVLYTSSFALAAVQQYQ